MADISSSQGKKKVGGIWGGKKRGAGKRGGTQAANSKAKPLVSFTFHRSRRLRHLTTSKPPAGGPCVDPSMAVFQKTFHELRGRNPGSPKTKGACRYRKTIVPGVRQPGTPRAQQRKGSLPTFVRRKSKALRELAIPGYKYEINEIAPSAGRGKRERLNSGFGPEVR